MAPMKNVLESFNVYMTAANLEGVDRRVTIRDVNEELQPTRNDDEEETKAPILYITEHPKGIRLNKTMATQLVDMFGTPDSSFWIGKQITIYPTKERAFGQTWDVIRIREETAPQQGGGFAGQPAADPAAAPPQNTTPAAPPQNAAPPAQDAQAGAQATQVYGQPATATAPAQGAQEAPAPAQQAGFEQPAGQPTNTLTREQAAVNAQAAQQQDQTLDQSNEWFG